MTICDIVRKPDKFPYQLTRPTSWEKQNSSGWESDNFAGNRETRALKIFWEVRQSFKTDIAGKKRDFEHNLYFDRLQNQELHIVLLPWQLGLPRSLTARPLWRKEHNSKVVQNSTLIDNIESSKYAVALAVRRTHVYTAKYSFHLTPNITPLLTKKLDLQILSIIMTGTRLLAF